MLTTGSTSSRTPEDCEAKGRGSVSRHGRGPRKKVVGREGQNSAPIGPLPDPSISTFVTFGRFRLYVSQRLLLEEGRPVVLGGHALELLIALVERPGEVVSKQELVARTWPGLTVEESNLRVQISVLRRTLRDGQSGERYISTVNGRGYCFVAPVTHNCETDQDDAMRDVQPMANSPRMSSSDHELCDGTAAGLAGCSLLAVVLDADLSMSFKEILAEYQQQISAVGVALLLVPAANPPAKSKNQQ